MPQSFLLDPSNNEKLSRLFLGAVHLGLFVLLAFILRDFSRYGYTDDWYYVDPLTMPSWREVVGWIFRPFIEHRLPIQKAAHLGLAYVTGFDYRVLLIFNLLVGVANSLLLAATARIYRGYQHWGDAIIPLLVLSPMSMWFHNSFALNYLSAVTFVAAYLYFISKYVQTGQKKYYTWALIQLFLCPFNGFNGLIMAVIPLLGAFTFFFFGERRLDIRSDKLHFFSALIVVAEFILHLVFLKASPATGLNTDLVFVAEIFIKMFSASMFVFALGNPAWRSLIIIIPLIFIGYLFYRRIREGRLSNLDVVLGSGLLSVFAINLSIPVGRGNFFGGVWRPHLILQYGCMTVFLPILSWVILSSLRARRFTFVLGVLAVGFFGSVFLLNLKSRIYEDGLNAEVRQEIHRALHQEPDVGKIVDKYIRELYYIDCDWCRVQVKKSITVLRQRGYPTYRLEQKAAPDSK